MSAVGVVGRFETKAGTEREMERFELVSVLDGRHPWVSKVSPDLAIEPTSCSRLRRLMAAACAER
jgi:hypothetical protein